MDRIVVFDSPGHRTYPVIRELAQTVVCTTVSPIAIQKNPNRAMAMSTEALMDQAEACELLGVGRHTLVRLIRKAKEPAPLQARGECQEIQYQGFALELSKEKARLAERAKATNRPSRRRR